MELFEQYVNPFVICTMHAFQNFVGFDLTAGHPHFSCKELVFDEDISAIINLSGNIQGSVVISMKRKFAIKITNTLVGSEHTEMDDDIVDAIGELVNIIIGNVKQELPAGENIHISVPVIVKGTDHMAAWLSEHTRVLTISFRHEDDICYLLTDMAKASTS